MVNHRASSFLRPTNAHEIWREREREKWTSKQIKEWPAGSKKKKESKQQRLEGVV